MATRRYPRRQYKVVREETKLVDGQLVKRYRCMSSHKEFNGASYRHHQYAAYDTSHHYMIMRGPWSDPYADPTIGN